MSTFTLAISCLNTSNLLWFVDLKFLVPVQYFSYSIEFPSPVTSTPGCCFCFGSISSVFLELFFHWSPVAYWAPTDLGVHLSVSYHFAFSYCSCDSQGKNTEVVCHSLLQWRTFLRTVYHDLSILGGPLEKTLMVGKIGRRRRRWQKMVRWHHWLNGHEFE